MGASIDSLSHFENGKDYPLSLGIMQGLISANQTECCFIAQHPLFGCIFTQSGFEQQDNQLTLKAKLLLPDLPTSTRLAARRLAPVAMPPIPG